MRQFMPRLFRTSFVEWMKLRSSEGDFKSMTPSQIFKYIRNLKRYNSLTPGQLKRILRSNNIDYKRLNKKVVRNNKAKEPVGADKPVGPVMDPAKQSSIERLFIRLATKTMKMDKDTIACLNALQQSVQSLMRSIQTITTTENVMLRRIAILEDKMKADHPEAGSSTVTESVGEQMTRWLAN